MGYRSCGTIFIPKELEEKLTDDMIIDLDENWEKEEVEDGTFYSFYDWKWYDEFQDVHRWTSFYYDYQDDGVDMLVIDEDNDIIVEPQFVKLGYSMNIEKY